MEQLRHIGEVLGSIRALMVFHDDIRINPRQCQLLFDAFEAAFACVSDQMQQNLRIDEKKTKWKPMEQPLIELHRVFRDGEQYIRQCLEINDLFGRSIFLTQSADCVELHLYHLLCSIPVVLESIESVGEVTGEKHEENHRRRKAFTKKYEEEWMDPNVFRHKFGKLYLVSQEMCRRMDIVAREDRWLLLETISDLKTHNSKQENDLANLLKSPRGNLLPVSILTSSPDYHVRRRLGTSSHLKEIQWIGESFALKHVFCDVDQMMPEISLLSSLTHPNVLHYMYCFADKEKKECFMVMELMNRDLSSFIKEVRNPRKKVPFSLYSVVNTMLQIARGMEYLHSKMIYHGDLKPSNILVKWKHNSSTDSSSVHVKIAGIGQSATKGHSSAGEVVENPCIWSAPELLLDDGQPCPVPEAENSSKYTEKSDVYSFGMICFELLTGKVPFEDVHLQGNKMIRNVRAGERPLFPFSSPKHLTNLTKRCWHEDPNQRPSFSSICRMLRYTKRFLVLNPESEQSEPPSPPLDYFDIEMNLSRKLESWQRRELLPVYEIPFEFYAYKVVERERISVNLKEKSSDSGSDASISGDEIRNPTVIPDETQSLSMMSSSAGSVKSVGHATSGDRGKKSMLRKGEMKPQSSKQTGNQKLKMEIEVQSPRMLSNGRGTRLNPDSQLHTVKSVELSPLKTIRSVGMSSIKSVGMSPTRSIKSVGMSPIRPIRSVGMSPIRHIKSDGMSPTRPIRTLMRRSGHASDSDL
ncbi:Light-sensor Protein kinase [Platanthera zijinensis]|uniref:Light-sensor Protein kinase n=1 Tax=Platanthera zijinensis TaxID=2320716 RepID=A0AAP0GAV1_9ASPA